MPKLKIQATKMSDAKVSYISLVERGANRIPFKIIKQEKGTMADKSVFAGLDLANLFTRKAEAAPEQVEVVGVVTMKGDDFDSIKAQLEEQGINVSDQTDMEDGSVVFKQVEGEMDGEGQIIRLNENVALITKGFAPYMMNMSIGDQTFEQVCKAQGFYPGVSTVMEVLRSSVMQLTEKAEDQSVAASDVANLFDEAKAYVTSMVSALPSVAFKAEVYPVIAEVIEKAGMKCPECGQEMEPDGDETKKVDGEEVCKGCGKAKKVVAAKTEEAVVEEAAPVVTVEAAPVAEVVVPAEEVVKAEVTVEATPAAKVEPSLTVEQVSAIVATQVGGVMDTLTKKMEEMMTSMVSGVTATVTKAIEGVEAKVEDVAKVAKSTSEEVAGIVVGGGHQDDQEVVTKKTERVGFIGREIDTAYNPSVRTRHRN